MPHGYHQYDNGTDKALHANPPLKNPRRREFVHDRIYVGPILLIGTVPHLIYWQ